MFLRKLITSILVFISIPAIAIAVLPPNTLKGKVTDANGEPVVGATVSIPDLKIGTITDINGEYQLQNAPKGSYLLEVRMLSYGTVTRQVTIENATEQNFRIDTRILEKNEVIITGTSLATEERKSAIPIQSIRIKELQENASTNIIDAIAKLPGVNQVSTGPAISKPVIRGLGSNRIITINDGIRQEGQQWGDEHGIEIDDYNVSRIEVLKGPASLAYGSDALAGVINIVPAEAVHEGKIQGSITTNYQTNSGLAALNAQVAGNIKGFIWDVYGTGKAAHDFKNKYDGYVHNSRFNNANYGAMIGLNKKWGYSHLSFTSFNQHLGLVEGERDSATGNFLRLIDNNGNAEETIVMEQDGRSYIVDIPGQRITHNKVAWNNNIYLNNGSRVGLTLGYQQNTRKEFTDVVNPSEPELLFQLNTFNYDVRYYFPQFKGWQVTAGVNGMQQNNKNKGTEFLVPDYNITDAGVYTIAKREWHSWSVSGGLRYNYRNVSGDALYLDPEGERVGQVTPDASTQFNAFDVKFSNLVGSLGTAYSVNNRTTIKFNVATGYRAPNIAELAANGIHEGTIRYEYGSTGLKPESSVQADLGVGWSSDHMLLNASVFYNYINNYIFIRKLLGVNGADSIPAKQNDEGFPAFVYDQGKAGLFGGELYFDLHPHPFDWLHFEHTFSYVRGKQFNATDSTSNLPYMPPARWLIELRAQTKSLGKRLANAYAKVGVDWNFAQKNIFNAYDTETETPGYSLLNAGIGMDVLNRKQKTLFSVTLSGNNLADVAYQNHLSRLKYAPMNNTTGRSGVYNMGRNFSVLVNVPLAFK